MNGTSLAGFDIVVSDLDRAADFYTRGLGLIEKAKEDHGDLHEVMVGGEQDLSVIVLVTAPGRTVLPVGDADAVKIVLHTDDAVGTYDRALAEGGTEVAPPGRVDEA